MDTEAMKQICDQCGLLRGYSHAKGKYRAEVLAQEGWRRIHKSWICPECVSEVRGRRNDLPIRA